MNDSRRLLRRRFFKERIPVYRADPVLFAREVLEFEPDKWQKDALLDLAGNPKVAVKSGQGVGKTGLEAVALLWFLTCFPYPRVVATAPTKQQLHDVLWSEISKWQERSPLLKRVLKWTKTYVYMVGYEKRWFATARTATKPENMQGFHEDNMLFIVDEASGVADPIMEAILGTLSGENNKLLLCGNPTRVSGAFFDAFHADRGLYKRHTVSSRDSIRTNKEHIASMDRKYGKSSNFVRVRVDGEFPSQEDDVFLPLSWLEQSVRTDVSEDTQKGIGAWVDGSGCKVHEPERIWSVDVGCDVARFGDDRTVIVYKLNESLRVYKKYNGQDTTWTAGNIYGLCRYLRDVLKAACPIAVKVDDGGVGGGVVDQLKAFQRREPEFWEDIYILPVQFGQPVKHKYFYDSTTFMMGVVRDLVAPFDDEGTEKPVELVLENDTDLIGQLSCRKYSFVSNGKQKVESKKEMKERGLTSPDEADAVLLACMPVKFKKKRRPS